MFPYVNSLNTDYFQIMLQHINKSEEPVWIEDLEITVLSSEDYNLNLYLQWLFFLVKFYKLVLAIKFFCFQTVRLKSKFTTMRI